MDDVGIVALWLVQEVDVTRSIDVVVARSC